MTVRELSQLHNLRCEIRILEERLEELRASMSAGSPIYDGMPHSKSNASKTERIASNIFDIEQKRLDMLGEAYLLIGQLEGYIRTIPDSLTRMIFRCRFIDDMSWTEIAAEIGGGNSEDSVKKRCYRYLAQKEEENGKVSEKAVKQVNEDPGSEGESSDTPE